MTNEKSSTYRIGAYVSREAWEKINLIQTELKATTGKRYSQGEILTSILKEVDVKKVRV